MPIDVSELKGPLAELYDQFSGQNGRDRFEEFKHWLKGVSAKLLRPVCEVFVGGSSRFAVDNFFTTKNKRVKIDFVSEDFKRIFGGLVEEGIPGLTLVGHELVQGALDPDIMAELGPEKRIVKLAHLAELMGNAHLAELMGKQSKSESKALLIYAEDAKGDIWAVGLRRRAGCGGWGVHACPVVARGWIAGRRVFSRK